MPEHACTPMARCDSSDPGRVLPRVDRSILRSRFAAQCERRSHHARQDVPAQTEAPSDRSTGPTRERALWLARHDLHDGCDPRTDVCQPAERGVEAAALLVRVTASSPRVLRHCADPRAALRAGDIGDQQGRGRGAEEAAQGEARGERARFGRRRSVRVAETGRASGRIASRVTLSGRVSVRSRRAVID